MPQHRIVDRTPRGGKVDLQRVVRGIAIDDCRVEIKLVGLERRVPVEIVGKRLVQVGFDGRRQRQPLA